MARKSFGRRRDGIPANKNTRTMDIACNDTMIMADSGEWEAFGSSFNGNAEASPSSDWAKFDDFATVSSDPSPSDTSGGIQIDPTSQIQHDVAPSYQSESHQEQEDTQVELKPDPEPLSVSFEEVALKRTVTPERTGSALTAQTVPETPPRPQILTRNSPQADNDNVTDDEMMLNKTPKSQLQALCAYFNLSTTGTKAEMLQRLRGFAKEQEEAKAAPDPEPSFEPAALKKTMSAERTASAVTAETLPETPVIDYGKSITMDDMAAKKGSSDTDSNSHDLTYDPEQPDESHEGKVMEEASQKPSKRRWIFYFWLVVIILLIAGALGIIVYIQLFYEVGLETNAPTTEPSAAPTEIPSQPPTEFPSLPPSMHPTMSPTTPRPTTRPPTSVPSRSPSVHPSIAPTTSPPTTMPSSNPTSVGENMLDLIASITDGKTIQAIRTSGTPQQKAYNWIVNDPAYFEIKKRRIVQRFAMAVLYYSVVGNEASAEAMSDWLDYDTNECTWFTSWYANRFACGSDDSFKTLSLRNVELTGTIPSELALLTRLETLVLSDNLLTGSLPKEFGEWASLVTLDVHYNFITGTIPTLTNALNLRELNLASNRLVGNVPTSIANLPLEILDLAENRVQGRVPAALCATSQQKEQIKMMTVDCDKVSCFCCTQCGISQQRLPTLTPFTPPPTRSPTKSPSSAPTSGACFTNIQTTKRCYKVGEPIDIQFRNCNRRPGDWVGLYEADNPPQLLLDPLLWHRTCGSKFCSDSPMHGSTTLDASGEGQVSWPLTRGNYKVYLIRNGSNFPYQPIIASEQFRVAQSICPD